jgi:hypothetical protein
MQVDTFDATLRNLERLNLIDSQSVLELYNWGEIFLHPDLQNIIRVINDHGLRYSISTNASTIPQIDEAFVKNLAAIRPPCADSLSNHMIESINSDSTVSRGYQYNSLPSTILGIQLTD